MCMEDDKGAEFKITRSAEKRRGLVGSRYRCASFESARWLHSKSCCLETCCIAF